MQNSLAIGIDIGGTKIATVLIDEAGTVLASHHSPTNAAEGFPAVIDRIMESIHYLQAQATQPIAGIGIGCPGHLNPNTGVVKNAVNLAWVEVPLVASIQQRLEQDWPVYLQKDTNAAALGEYYFGAARGCTDFMYIAPGTGLGAGAMVNGQLVIGANFYATDIGHLAPNPTGRLCACGLRGCVETYISGNGLKAGIAEHRTRFPQSPLAQSQEVTTAAILQAARDGDELAVTVMNEAADWLGLLFAYGGAMFNPELFILGGGLGLAAADLLLERATREFQRRVLPIVYEKAQILLSQVTDSAVGAASLVWYHRHAS